MIDGVREEETESGRERRERRGELTLAKGFQTH
jgi:hypothetical protein